MTPEIQDLPFDELRTLHREIGALIAEKRAKELADLRERAATLGFTPEDFVPRRTARGRSHVAYRNPDNADENYGGKGKRPAWLQAKLDAGHELEEFKV